MRDSFVFYRSFYEAIKDLPRDVQGEVYTAIMEYSLNGITTEQLKPIARSILTLIKPILDINNQRFENGRKGAEFGKLGGRPKKEENPKRTPKEPQENTKQTPNKDEDVDGNVYDDDNVNSGKGDGTLPLFSPPDFDGFSDFQTWILKNAPLVARMREPFTINQYLSVCKLYSIRDIKQIIEEMHNWKPLLSKNVSAYKTLRKWMDKRK